MDMDKFSPNRRIHEARIKGERIATYTNVPKCTSPDRPVSVRPPLPGVVILVHGVNDIGEAYPTQAAGLCEGLNLRLGRKDITPGTWDVPRACPEQRRASFERRADAQGYNAIIPFYWGYRPVDMATFEADQQRYEEELRRRGPAGAEAPYDAYYVEGRSNPRTGYQNTDCFGNWLDEHFCKNGGVFANATTNLIDMWGPGGDIFGLAKWLSSQDQDLSHAIFDNPHRIYMVNAAQRLANLILMIRANKASRDDSLNIVAHSQGTLVSMLANYLVSIDDSGLRPADCLILNHSPYSLETPFLERHQSFGPQQSKRARRETLANLCRLIDAHRTPAPSAAALVCEGMLNPGVANKPGHLNDNHGKVFNYFCPHDGTVSLRNVQGIGWQGVPVAEAGQFGAAFVQRLFLDGRALATPPGKMQLPDLKRASITTNSDVPTGEVRDINAPQLPDFGYVFQRPGGCAYLGASDWGVDSAAQGETGRNVKTEVMDDPRREAGWASSSFPFTRTEQAEVERAFKAQGKDWEIISVSGANARGKIMVTRYMTEQEMLERARRTETSNSNHSAIVLDQNASCYAAAFDLALGRCRSYDWSKIDGGAFWQKLLRVADWRDSDIKFDRDYYTQGVLPPDIKQQMNKPPTIPGIVNESTEARLYSSELQNIDERIAAHEQHKGQWPKLEWEEKMRSLQMQRRSIVQAREYALEKQSRFPVVHGE
ncbi:DUF3274 domain-containing protein [Nitrogeniibacter mangrovi]|uniref:DUF3274 domain-containing protein n=1 Tax=Nitrogeniibacter mangrovi TaxID=2016596 RepID=A0A6C1AY24_9RHOO|nr:DUF3274 domain-containing protein [Nitrogeniibacter mangrovi]QID16261.1 DUF3274 domain-containing protein [Nitrogeniibacter mangrovi]